MAWARPALPVWQYVVLLACLHEAMSLPVVFYRGFLLDRRYELSTEPASVWIRDHLKAFGITTVFAVLAAEGLYALMRSQPGLWWPLAAVAATVISAAMARLAPILLLPLFYQFRPLDRPELAGRLVALSNRAGVRVLGVYEWALGAKTRRANAALTGAGATRRILLSDTLLAEYSDDEIEVILAHELAHHVHHDIPKALAVQFVLLLAALCAADVALSLTSGWLGLQGITDPRGMPLLLAAAGAVMWTATPLVNAVSRAMERRADAFALALTRRGDAFASAMRRLGSQNLAEESPSRAAVWLFHTHPPVEERIEAAKNG